MNPTRHNNLFSYDLKAARELLKSKNKGYEAMKLAQQDVEHEYVYKAPRKLSNIEIYNNGRWLEREFPKVNPA